MRTMSCTELKKYLPHDVVVEILTRLPPEKLLRYRSVCKLWSSTIDDANFIANNQKHNAGNDCIVALTLPKEDEDENIRSQPVFKYRLFSDGNCIESIHDVLENWTDEISAMPWKVEGTCNGIFCYTGLWRYKKHDDYYKIYLCNPLTRQVSILPDYRGPSQDISYKWRSDRFGIGFDTLEKTYKIIKEVFKELQLPKHEDSQKVSIHVVGGSLSAMACDADDFACHIWTMKEYGIEESWIKQHKVLFPYECHCLEVTYGGKILCVINDDYLFVVKKKEMLRISDKNPKPRRMIPYNCQKYILYDPQSTDYYTTICPISFDSIVVFSIEGSLANFL
ncbi:uncharacterized protein LOC127250583 [Andrographis paniculata]|uniref:uncharacterized protein LOC127250583 n=1 Tax=Andrographis paniculata TaxID=175694 RepID=UPI0021E79031|nr:uncharacterized protein LOC127250583 [Andrographis paniculata]